MKSHSITKHTKKAATHVEGLRSTDVDFVPIENVSANGSYQYSLSSTTSDLEAAVRQGGQREPISTWVDALASSRRARLHLKRELRKSTGAKPVGRKTYDLSLDKASLRLDSFALSEDTLREKRIEVATMLAHAVAPLRRW